MISFLYRDIHCSCLLHLDRSVNVLHCINVLQLLDMWSASCTEISTVLVCYTWTGLSMFYTVLMCYIYWICDQLLVQRYPLFMSITPGPVCQCSTLDMWSASCTEISTVLVCYTWTGNTVLMCYSYWICDQLLVQRYPPFMSITPGPVCQCSTLY